MRVHPGTPDVESLSALAFTQGRDIHFAPDQYNPASQEGQKIFATLSRLGLDEDTINAPDGWKAAVEELDISGNSLV